MTRRDFLGRLGLGAGILALAPTLDLAPLPAPSIAPAVVDTFFLNGPYVLWVSASPTFEFGFTGFKPGDEQVSWVGDGTGERLIPFTRHPRRLGVLHGVSA